MILIRVIPRNSEHSFFPPNSNHIQGMLTKEGTINGLQEISPSHNIQFIPYTSVGAFRALDERDPAADRFTGKHVEPKAGLDSKVVIKDSMVLDATINPDFGQIESDDPQVTVNQRFEVFFPEKRPFFQENSNFFQTPLNLVFTRRIVDPLYGIRLTGKEGPWAMGAMLADDRSPGRSVIGTDPLAGAERILWRAARESRTGKKQQHRLYLYRPRAAHQSRIRFAPRCAALWASTALAAWTRRSGSTRTGR